MTLIEVLVVLTLIAVGTGAVSLALPDRASERGIAQEAALLAARLNLAAERSLVEGRSYRMTWDRRAYRFATWEDGAWHASENAVLPAEHGLDAGALLMARSGAEGGVLVIGPDLLPPQSGVLQWEISSGTTATALRFDGLHAQAEAGL